MYIGLCIHAFDQVLEIVNVLDMSRDILAPQLRRMSNNRCYRLNLVNNDFGGSRWLQGNLKHTKGYVENELCTEYDDDVNDYSCTIEEMPNSMFKLTMHVANVFYGGLIGTKGSTKRRIELETQTEIYVPRSADKSHNVIIKGKLRSNVCTAKQKIKYIQNCLRARMRPTHFIAVALNSGEVKQKFAELKQQILAAGLPGIDEQLFQKDQCLHLTLGLCVLLDDDERAKAVEILHSCRNHLDGLKTPFVINISGLEIMNDDPSAVRVVYACINAPELQIFANNLMRPFEQSNLAATDKFKRDSVKLHMTVLNNKYRKESNAMTSDNFDARELLKRFGDYSFGRAECDELQLCVLNSSRDVEDFYKISGSIKFQNYRS